MKEIDFKVPFSGFCGTTFINCFTSVYVYLEGVETGKFEFDCVQREGKSCNSCGACENGGNNPIAVQERYFFFFDTISGRSSTRLRFDGTPTAPELRISEDDLTDGRTDGHIDFLFGYTGYEYEKLTSGDFKTALEASVNAGVPVIAKVKSGEGRFRVITGYDGGSLICPDYTNAQNRPDRAPAYDELECLYIIGKKSAPRFTFADALDNIIGIMEYNASERLWNGYCHKMTIHGGDGLNSCDADGKKQRMNRVAQTMWHTFNCHNFAEVFRQRRFDELKNPAFDGFCGEISWRYGYTHDLAWSLIGLNNDANWSSHPSIYYGEMVELILCKLEENDAAVLDAVRGMRKAL